MFWIKIDGKNNHDTYAMDTAGMGVLIRSVHVTSGPTGPIVEAESMVHVPGVKLEGSKLVPAYDLTQLTQSAGTIQ